MITKSDDSDINIKKEDQEKINQFAITHAKDTELNVELNQIKKDLDSLKDASEEILITEENDIPYMIGENFVLCDKDDIENKIQQQTELYQKRKMEIANEIEELTKIKDKLKAELTAKLGTSINLTVE
ncbi:uncharacterized protein LOC135925089 [Gordionus sp. m RMFG-2023]|uniref:uncharacterized protein LOC135925089 n=1 Tax=Gordionus sp. m RMFG-2023 TaxID=3053472 RepID=UPI0031FE0217